MALHEAYEGQRVQRITLSGRLIIGKIISFPSHGFADVIWDGGNYQTTEQLINLHSIEQKLFGYAERGTMQTQLLASTFDPVQRPAHYNQDRKYDPFEVAHDWKLPSTLGGAIKYIARAGRKEGSPYTQDLEKAIKCIKREIELWSTSQLVNATSAPISSGQEPSIAHSQVDANGAKDKK